MRDTTVFSTIATPARLPAVARDPLLPLWSCGKEEPSKPCSLGCSASVLSTKLSFRQRLPGADGRVVPLRQTVLDGREKKCLVEGGRCFLLLPCRESAQGRWQGRLIRQSVHERVKMKYHQGGGSNCENSEKNRVLLVLLFIEERRGRLGRGTSLERQHGRSGDSSG
ncbi:MAG: hypothetical protein MZV63_16900 [Marinilabiliales bacterium]|nr:hypothetical protein [Marinilabiliales bacterium]